MLELEKIVPEVGDGWKEIISHFSLSEVIDLKEQMIESIKTCLELAYSEIKLAKTMAKKDANIFLDVFVIHIKETFYNLRIYKLLEERQKLFNENEGE